jgi:1-acyl-sn-glycerol-3-phosphate acyltransferase
MERDPHPPGRRQAVPVAPQQRLRDSGAHRKVGNGQSLEDRLDLAFDRATAPRPGEAEQAGAALDYGLDLDFRSSTRPLFRFLYENYWRVSVTGADHVPSDGPVILVGNHSGGVPFDATMLAYAMTFESPGPQRVVRPLYDKFVENLTPVCHAYRKLGGAPASYAVADELLSRGEAVAIFPEGIDGVAKLYEDRYQLADFSSSAARLSCRHRLPIVPFAVVGAEEIYPVIGRSEKLGKAIGAPYVPITPLFPMLGLAGAIPLPSKWSIVFGPRIYLYRERRFRGAGCMDFDTMSERLRRTVQILVQSGVDRRSSIFLG